VIEHSAASEGDGKGHVAVEASCFNDQPYATWQKGGGNVRGSNARNRYCLYFGFT
jgi:hypothetical protein